jgi:protein-S-isoprenylcysteine O-methyltransferase Ste14
MFLGDELRIGLCNAWIGTILAWANMLFLAAVNKDATKRLYNMTWYTPKDKIYLFLTMVMMIVIVVYSVFLPVKYVTDSFWIGTAIYIIGTIANLMALYDYGTTPEDKPIVKGLYRYSRNPLYVCWIVALAGICIACESWPLVILSAVYCIPTHFLILGEEKYCMKTYKDSYVSYMKQVPRYLLFF